MTTNNRTAYLSAILLLGALVVSIGNAWAAQSSCTYAASGTGMGGTGIVANNAEMGGTGMGGTGITPGVALAELRLAGTVTSSSGRVEARSNGRSRLLAKGGSVCVGETIVTAKAGSLQIRMIDDALVAVQPQTQLKIDEYAYNGTNKDASLITVFKGASRFVTGKLGKRHPQNDLVETPNATVGVLGTDHEVKVILPGEGGGYQSGTYDKVNQGITFIETDKGRVDIHPNQVGLAVSNAEMPILLKDIPDFYNAEPSNGDIENAGKPLEAEHQSIEPPESHSGIEEPEAATHTEVPDSFEQPAIPELPSEPEAPDPPETQE